MIVNLGPKHIMASVGAVLLLLGMFLDAGYGSSFYEAYPLAGMIIGMLTIITLVLVMIAPERLIGWLMPLVGLITLLIILSTKLPALSNPYGTVYLWGEVLLFAGSLLILLTSRVSRKITA